MNGGGRWVELLSELSRLAREMPLLVLALVSLSFQAKSLNFCLTGGVSFLGSSVERQK